MDFEHLLASRTKRMGASAIRELLKVVSQPGMISLAGGIPAPESFPLEIIGELTDLVLEKYGARALQYDRTEGFIPLQEALVGYLAERDIRVSADEIMVTSGSQGVLDSVAKILVSKGERIAVEAPTYVGAIQAFNPYEPEYVRMDTDEDGLIPESLEEVLASTQVKFVYLVPTFQNPTGRTITLERRRQIAEIIQRYDALLLEDDPYSALRYRGDPLPPIRSLAPEHVIYTSTLSKVLAPGLRIGFCVAPPLISRWLVLVKQGVDLHTSTFNQALATEYLTGGYLARHLPNIVRIYKPKQEAMLKALEEHFPDCMRWSRPDGGMFVWAEGPEDLNGDEVYERGLERKVAYVPGKYFYTQEGEGLGTMRLNYTMIDEATIHRGIQTLGEVIDQVLCRS